MSKLTKFRIFIVILLNAALANAAPQQKDITIEKLSQICAAMENAINSIQISYEWYVDPPADLNSIAGTGMLIDKGHAKYELLSERPFSERVRLFRWTTICRGNGDCWDDTDKSSYDGKISKHLSIGGFPPPPHAKGEIAQQRRFVPESMNLTPLGFSVLRTSFSDAENRKPLSEILKDKSISVLKSDITKINGFDCIAVDLINQQTQRPVMRIYFSVENGFAPVRYYYINGNDMSYSVDITSLQQVSEGLWFPDAAVIYFLNGKKNVYKATAPIVVNQKIAPNSFDIEFPSGTKVHDLSKNETYFVNGSAKQNQELEAIQNLDENKKQQITKRFYSMDKLRKLSDARGLFIVDNNSFPQDLTDLKQYLDANDFAWLAANIVYLGKERTRTQSPALTLAYDKSLLKTENGTSVLLMDGTVRFLKKEELQNLGIE